MENPTDMGMNRTGIAMSPVDSKKTIDFAQSVPPSSEGNMLTEASVLTTYTQEAMPVGKVPPPGSLKGVAKTGMEKLTGKKPEAFLDKLGERLAFERSGTRLYDALIAKCRATQVNIPGYSLDLLVQFRNEEARHFKLVEEAIRTLGADPTAMTPCADVAGVESMGLMQVLNEPRMTVAQSLHAILIGELADNDGWQSLSALAQQMGQEQMVTDFQEALAEEDIHLRTIRQWVHDAAMMQIEGQEPQAEAATAPRGPAASPGA